MNGMKKWIVLLMTVVMVFAMCACGNADISVVEEGAETVEKVAEDVQNPAMNFIGNYRCDRANVQIGADGQEGMKAIVTWSGSAAEESKWVMSGTFDPETLQFEYHDCVKSEIVYDEDGTVKSEEKVFEGGHGFMTFKEGDALTLTWQEDQEHVADDMVFTYE